MALGSALRDFRRNWVFTPTREAFEWPRGVDLIVAHLGHSRGQSDEEAGKDYVVSPEYVPLLQSFQRRLAQKPSLLFPNHKDELSPSST